MSTFRVKNKDGTWDKVPVLGSYQAVLAANEAATNAQNAAKEVKEIYGDGNFTPLSDLLGSLGTKLKRWGTIFANKVFASNLPIVYNSVAEMKADTMLWEGMNTKTLGYYAPNDGGGAYYLIRAKADSDVDDGGSLHKLSNGLVAELIVENGTVYPEQFGYDNKSEISDVAITIKAILMAGFRQIKLLPKIYNLRSTLDIKDFTNGYIEGASPMSLEAVGTSYTGGDVIPTIFECKSLNGKSAINIQGCLNFCLKNFYLRALNDDDCPSVGIYLGRTESHLSSQWNNIDGVAVSLTRAITLNSGKGSIAVYNNAAEQFKVVNGSFIANIGIVNTDKDCFNIAESLGGYNYSGATCTAVVYDNNTIGATIAMLFSKVSNIIFTNIFWYDPFKTEVNSKCITFDYTNSEAKYITNCTINVCSEQCVKPYFIYTNVENMHILWNKFDFYYSGLDKADDGYIIIGKYYSLTNNTFNLHNASEALSEIMADISQIEGTCISNMFIGGQVKLYRSQVGSFSTRSGYGCFGSHSILDPNFPFYVNGIGIGSYWGQPISTEQSEGSIALETNANSNVAFWIYRNGAWKPVNIDG